MRLGGSMEKIGIIGAGVMGSGIASLFCNYKYEVKIFDINADALEKAKDTIKKNNILFMFQQKVKKYQECIFVDTLEAIGDSDIVIEAVSENLETKLEVFKILGGFHNRNQIVISNTSCVPISELGEQYGAADRVVGVHFMNPVTLIKAVEIIKGSETSDNTLNHVFALLESVNKKYYVVKDSPGFVSNRISHLYMNEAAYLLQEKVADVESIDGIFKNCYGHKMGPLETADLIGIDVVVDSLNVLYQKFKDNKFVCCPLLKEMVNKKQIGRKSGKGFYTY